MSDANHNYITLLERRIAELETALQKAADNLRICGSVSQAKYYDGIVKGKESAKAWFESWF